MTEIYTVETDVHDRVEWTEDFDNLRDALIYAHVETSICESEHVDYHIWVWKKCLMADYQSQAEASSATLERRSAT